MGAPPVLYANNELVTVAWLGSIPGLSEAMVATQLPSATLPDGSNAPWVQTGFIVVTVVGGIPGDTLPVNMAVMQCDCYAANPGSNKPPWFRANNLASVIQRATWDRYNISRLLTIRAGGVTYPPATVQTAWLASAPRRLWGDPGDYAVYSADLALTWITAGDRLD